MGLRIAAICAAIVLAPLVIPSAFAQAGYPNRPIKLVVPYPPGALTDSRHFALSLQLQWAADRCQP